MAQKKKAVTTSKALAKAKSVKPKVAPAAKTKVAVAQVKLSKAAVKAKVAPAKAKPVVAKAPAAPVKVAKKPVVAKVAVKKPAVQPVAAAAKKLVVGAAKVEAAKTASAPRTVPAAVARKALNQRIAAPAGSAPKPAAKVASKPVSAEPKKPVNQRHGFKANEYVVYPSHGVGRIVGIEEQEIAGMALELFVITFDKEKLTLRVPTGKLESVGMRKLADEALVKKALDILKGRARIKRTMWSRRAQEYIAKINSGDLISIAEVVRDLYRSEAQPEQSYSERQLYEDALDRMSREIAAVEKLDDRGAVQRITDILSKSAKSRRAEAEAEAVDEAAA